MTIRLSRKQWSRKPPYSNLPKPVAIAKAKASKKVRVVSKAKAHAPRGSK